MKVVINKCYGGFGVSVPAMKDMFGRCSHVVAHEPSKYYGSKAKWEEDKNNKDSFRDWRYFDKRGWPVTDEHRESDRSCPVLIETVERMGSKAGRSLSKLRIVEIPDGVEFEINEYDGVESIHEVHQTWG